MLKEADFNLNHSPLYCQYISARTYSTNFDPFYTINHALRVTFSFPDFRDKPQYMCVILCILIHVSSVFIST